MGSADRRGHRRHVRRIAGGLADPCRVAPGRSRGGCARPADVTEGSRAVGSGGTAWTARTTERHRTVLVATTGPAAAAVDGRAPAAAATTGSAGRSCVAGRHGRPHAGRGPD